MEQLHVLRDLAVIFAGSLLVILVFYRLKLPALPGFIVAGMLLGPNALGLVSDPHDVESLAEVGVILLLFTIGIEFSLSRLREMQRQILGSGFAQMGFTVLVALAVGLALLREWRIALFLGFLIALSSTAIVLKVLTDQSEIDAPHGRLATGVLIFQDLCVVPIMLVLPFLAGKAEGGVPGLLLALGKAALVVVGVILAARTIVPRALTEILKTRSRELFLIAVILIGTLTALGTAAAGASLALGAFLAGLIISESDYGYQAMAELMPFRDIFISLFFVAVGMLVQLQTLWAHLALTLVAVAVIMGGKTLAAAVGPALMGYSGRVALLAGVAVSQIGEFSFVLAKEGRVAGLLPDLLYQQFLGIAVITMLVTPFLLQGGPAMLDALERVVPLDRLLPGFRPRELAAVHEQVKDHVVIAGYGLNGRNLAAALRSIHAPYLIVELNAQTVRKARAEGEPAFYGDATREEILRALGVDRARMLVIAISDPAATRAMVRVARDINTKLYIVARTRYVVEIPELTRLGANAVIPEEFETSIEIFARVLAHYNVPRDEIERLVSEIRASHYQALRPGARPRLSLKGSFGALRQMHVERIILPANTAVVGQTIAETQLRSTTGALILAVRRGEDDFGTPGADFRLDAGDVLVVIGQPPQIKAAYRLLTGTEPG
ncbi:MAG TPA: cation:proton antiporter [Gemmatimonadales bacterium]|jgi:CPA2 family monovalent cation:H+ antiporter-2|nr:cation:proton antiporter [Gemmatimonadales bacterium]